MVFGREMTAVVDLVLCRAQHIRVSAWFFRPERWGSAPESVLLDDAVLRQHHGVLIAGCPNISQVAAHVQQVPDLGLPRLREVVVLDQSPADPLGLDGDHVALQHEHELAGTDDPLTSRHGQLDPEDLLTADRACLVDAGQ